MSVVSPEVSAITQMSSPDSKERVGRAIGRIASGVFIVTTKKEDGQRDGFLASWINQAAFEPPMVSVAIRKGRHFLELLSVGSHFTINVLAKSNMDLYKHFVTPYLPGSDRFEGVKLLPGTTRAPVLADALAYLSCVSKSMVEAGDHVLVIGEVLDGGLLMSDTEPLIHLRSDGFKY